MLRAMLGFCLPVTVLYLCFISLARCCCCLCTSSDPKPPYFVHSHPPSKIDCPQAIHSHGNIP
ncbi:hypothetical protein JB92DRAFT_3048275 [Gautieria morchelliformis]|nr:hypothetical protein JB92DRAFT_3048275 [Gautieria morchelliformis]